MTKAAATPEVKLLNTVTHVEVSDAIKNAGCAVTTNEQDGITRIHSASHGIGFQVLWGNALSAGQFVDFTLSCPLRIQGGTLPEGVLTEWHRTKRFARVALHGDFVVLEMDVMVAGGVTPANLEIGIQLWTQMMGQFFLHLRNFKPETAAPAEVAQAKADVAAETEKAAEEVAA